MFAALLKAGVSFAEIDGKTTVALWQKYKALRLVALSCPTLCNPMDCSSPSSSVHGDSPGKITGVDWHALLQGIIPTQGSNLHLLLLLYSWQILYH